MLAFVFQFHSLISTSFLIKEGERKVKELSLTNEQMSFSLLRKNRFENLENLAGQLGFQEVEEVEYIEVLSSEVASRSR